MHGARGFSFTRSSKRVDVQRSEGYARYESLKPFKMTFLAELLRMGRCWIFMPGAWTAASTNACMPSNSIGHRSRECIFRQA